MLKTISPHRAHLLQKRKTAIKSEVTTSRRRNPIWSAIYAKPLHNSFLRFSVSPPRAAYRRRPQHILRASKQDESGKPDDNSHPIDTAGKNTTQPAAPDHSDTSKVATSSEDKSETVATLDAEGGTEAASGELEGHDDPVPAVDDSSIAAVPEYSVPQERLGLMNLYPWWVDIVPALTGRLNPITGILIYFSGAVLAETISKQVLGIAVQWFLLAVLPVHGLLMGLKFWWFRRSIRQAAKQAEAAREAEAGPSEQKDAKEDVKIPQSSPSVQAMEDEDKESASSVEEGKFEPTIWRQFLVTQRPAWIDFQIATQLLLPAGMSGQEGADVYLLFVIAAMAVRFLGRRKMQFLSNTSFWMRRAGTVVLGAPALLLLLGFGVKGAWGSVSALTVSGLAGLLMLPLTIGLTYLMYVAPALLLPGAVVSAWKGQLYRASPPKPKVKKVLTPEEKAQQRKSMIMWFVAYALAMVITNVTGSDVPFVALMMLQIFKTSPDKLMQILIDKGERIGGKKKEEKLDAKKVGAKDDGDKSDAAKTDNLSGTPGTA
ncbi:hypothetical protein CYMTET_26708 [Cymbomonas tetramitiformis]|uniref:Uncharacterized protein n=1 Tax=Cymbomonas tetramitiformis TaxID=36881 RepID=A0AAE0FR83_9CHLO|nr:hypothetical protein CYMTET_26708 [Cymbomonas tetramitiformis]